MEMLSMLSWVVQILTLIAGILAAVFSYLQFRASQDASTPYIDAMNRVFVPAKYIRVVNISIREGGVFPEQFGEFDAKKDSYGYRPSGRCSMTWDKILHSGYTDIPYRYVFVGEERMLFVARLVKKSLFEPKYDIELTPTNNTYAE
jgi:hypothetical protein